MDAPPQPVQNYISPINNTQMMHQAPTVMYNQGPGLMGNNHRLYSVGPQYHNSQPHHNIPMMNMNHPASNIHPHNASNMNLPPSAMNHHMHMQHMQPHQPLQQQPPHKLNQSHHQHTPSTQSPNGSHLHHIHSQPPPMLNNMAYQQQQKLMYQNTNGSQMNGTHAGASGIGHIQKLFSACTNKINALNEKISLEVSNGNLYGPAALPNGSSVIEFSFELAQSAYNEILKREDLDIILLCRNMPTPQQQQDSFNMFLNFLVWPRFSNISMNNHQLPLKLSVVYNQYPLAEPIYIKNTCCVGKNTVKIEITNPEVVSKMDLSTHVFHVYMVHRPALKNALLMGQEQSQVHSDHLKQALMNYCTRTNQTTVTISRMCPLSFTPIDVPVRFNNCDHIQPVDLLAFYQFQAKWMLNICPVCCRPIKFNFQGLEGNLCIDQVLIHLFRSPEYMSLDKFTFNIDGSLVGTTATLTPDSNKSMNSALSSDPTLQSIQQKQQLQAAALSANNLNKVPTPPIGSLNIQSGPLSNPNSPYVQNQSQMRMQHMQSQPQVQPQPQSQPPQIFQQPSPMSIPTAPSTPNYYNKHPQQVLPNPYHNLNNNPCMNSTDQKFLLDLNPISLPNAAPNSNNPPPEINKKPSLPSSKKSPGYKLHPQTGVNDAVKGTDNLTTSIQQSTDHFLNQSVSNQNPTHSLYQTSFSTIQSSTNTTPTTNSSITTSIPNHNHQNSEPMDTSNQEQSFNTSNPNQNNIVSSSTSNNNNHNNNSNNENDPLSNNNSNNLRILKFIDSILDEGPEIVENLGDITNLLSNNHINNMNLDDEEVYKTCTFNGNVESITEIEFSDLERILETSKTNNEIRTNKF